jgi:predicted GIY-YIG superfamily endonuclease
VKRPAFQFYPGDWRKDPELQACSILARGVWWEMLCLMHECRPYGHLAQSGKPMSDQAVANNIRVPLATYRKAVSELETNGVPSRTADGTIYSRRMVRDERMRQVRAEAGGLGGNPELVGEYHREGFLYVMQRSSDGAVKIGISSDPAKRLYKVRQARQGEHVTLLAKYAVSDMGKAEAEAHAMFAEHRLDSEWFASQGDIANRLDLHLNAKTTSPVDSPPPPSSSASAGLQSSASLNPGVEDVHRPTLTAPSDNPAHPAIEKNGHGTLAKDPAWWKTPEGVAATAQTIGIERRTNESDPEFRDRVYTEVESRRRKALAHGKARRTSH